MPLTAGMGATNVVNVQDAGNNRVATTGDFVLVASEVNPTVAALRAHHFEVTAMHQHMIGMSRRCTTCTFGASARQARSAAD